MGVTFKVSLRPGGVAALHPPARLLQQQTVSGPEARAAAAGAGAAAWTKIHETGLKTPVERGYLHSIWTDTESV